MNYPSFEVRKTRATFTAKLHKVFARLDDCASREVEFRFLGRHSKAVVTVAEVWVVGSYARGALHCGDLDLVVRVSDAWAPSCSVNSALLGKIPDVRTYVGTPEQNESGVEFPEARRVWARGLDWKSALEAIKEDANAGRFRRPTDAIPLRLEQLILDIDNAKELVQAQASDVYRWSFTPIEALVPARDTSNRIGRWSAQLSKARQALVPFVQAYFNGFEHLRSVDEGDVSSHCWTKDDTCVFLGHTAPDFTLLDQPGISRIAVMPVLNVRGPNGIWTIERGPQHRVDNAFRQSAGWLLMNEGKPVIIEYTGQYNERARALEVFSSQDAALKHIKEAYADDDSPPPVPAYLRGAEYLAALRGIELLDFVDPGVRVAFNSRAALVGRDFDAVFPASKDLPEWFNGLWREWPTQPAM